MSEPKIHLFDGIPFVASPYERGLVRHDVFSSQFRIICQGLLEFPEDDLAYGTWWTAATLLLGECGLIEEAVQLAQDLVSNHTFDLDQASGELDFVPQVIRIRDRHDRLVLAGDARCRTISWFAPVGSDEEAATIATQARTLHDEGSVEQGWDNYETAKGLWLQADLLRGRLVDPLWREHARRAITVPST
ncbi:hypothetical protein ACMAUO_14870 [Gluconacetobacter sp. Hr-1-5]|uniref:hypothetical protein n=1 Tax=Gluconacetobacter sp. Hr-1-5 TaxID=3395370 RepID=UPI003B522F03